MVCEYERVKSRGSEREVDRYCAWPGQACGYKVGHSEINRLRTETRNALGEKFDLRRFMTPSSRVVTYPWLS